MRTFFIVFLLLFQSDDQVIQSILDQRSELNAEFRDPETSPLTEAGLKNFTGLEFFPIDLHFRVKAYFELVDDPVEIRLPTTTSRKPVYKEYGKLSFVLNERSLTLTTYLNEELNKQEEYHDYLFLPFLDKTNGESTYGGGRYIDFKIPEGDSVYVDFNLAYNPYCCYSHRYSCPLVPRNNYLPVEIKAGVKGYDGM